jgi:hypothetical protein
MYVPQKKYITAVNLNLNILFHGKPLRNPRATFMINTAAEKFGAQ